MAGTFSRWIVLFPLTMLALSVMATPALADIVVMPDTTWREKNWKSGTRFTDTTFDGKPALAVEADSAGSLKTTSVNIDLKHYPLIDFFWAAQSSLRHQDERTQAGNDFATRVLVLLQDSDGRRGSINYVWSSSQPVGAWLDSPYSTSRMLVVQSGIAQSSHFSHIARNLLTDAQVGLGFKEPQVTSIAIMSDTDQTGEKTQAWYGRIRFVEPSREAPTS